MKYVYDIAISYQSELVGTAEKIKGYLEKDNKKVFFAPDRQQELVSEQLRQELYNIYKNESLLKLLLISERYLSSEWTQIEQRMALESTKDDRKRLVLVNYTERPVLPGKLRDLVYIDGKSKTEDEVAAFVTERIDTYLDKNPETNEKKKCNSDRETGYRQNTQFFNVNNGIQTGDNAHFGNITFGK